MTLSAEGVQRFTDYVVRADTSATAFGQDDALLGFVAWALVHEPGALHEAFALDGIMAEHGVNDNKVRYVHAVLGVAQPLIAAYERERATT